MECGAAARTRIAKAPRWKAPFVIAGVISALAIGTLGYAFAELTANDGRLVVTTTTTAAPVVPNPAVETTKSVPPVSSVTSDTLETTPTDTGTEPVPTVP